MRSCVIWDVFINCTCAGWRSDLSSSSGAGKGLGVSGHHQLGVRGKKAPLVLVPCTSVSSPGTAVKRTGWI